MPTKISAIETLVRQNPLIETTAKFWTSAELTSTIIAGIKDLWRDIVDLKQSHFLTIDDQNVTLPANSSTLNGVPQDVHKVYLIEPRDITESSTNVGIIFKPLDYNDTKFQGARSRSAIDPSNDLIYYDITGAGAPVGSPVIRVAPQVNSAMNVTFCYIPILPLMTTDSDIPIPGECDNALMAWCGAFARAKEREDRSPDPAWLAIYATEKQHLLQSLGLRQLQEPTFTDAVFESNWP